jgi:hypothetical protein
MQGRLLAGAGAALVVALMTVGCGTNTGSLGGYVPEGQPNSAFLYTDVEPVSSVDSSQVWVYGVVFDRTPTEGFRLYIDPAGAGFRPAADFLSVPTHTYSTGYSEYRIRSDVPPDLTGPNDYIARGARRGMESHTAPLTTHAWVPPGSALALARRLDVTLLAPVDSAITDSTPTLSWASTPGAVRYLLRIRGRNGIVYLTLTDATTHQVEVSAGTRFEDMPMRAGLLYRWEVFAINAENRIIGHSPTLRALLVN